MQSSMQRDKKLSAAKSKPFEIKSSNCCRTKVRDLCVNYCLPPSQALCRRAQLVSYLEQRAVETNWDVESLPSRGQDSGWVAFFRLALRAVTTVGDHVRAKCDGVQ